MSLIVSGTTIPTNGDYIVVGGTKVSKVNVVRNGVSTTVWEKIISTTPPAANIIDYLNITGGTPSTCSDHGNCPRFIASIWYRTNGGGSVTETFVVKPKDPYTKITATFNRHGGLVHSDHDTVWVEINGTRISSPYTVTNASQITVKCYAGTEGWDEHWKTECWCCMYNVTMS